MMVSSREETLVYNIKLSSVGPGKMTGQDVVHEPTNMDLAMKLHYLKGVYYFNSQAFNGLTTMKIKEPMFTWFNHYYFTCGRFRRSESSGGRPYIKCNDCGARFIEAQCDKTIDEWMDIMKKDGNLELEKLLVYSQAIGPELAFSPPVLLQLTKFRCGGFTLGLSWAHVLGDAFFAAEFINTWGHFLAGHKSPPHPPVKLEKPHPITQIPATVADESLAVKRVGPVGDYWAVPNDTKMVAFSLDVTSTQLGYIQSNLRGKNDAVDVPPFEALCAVIWRCIAKVRNGVEPKVVTLCRNDKKGSLGNNNQGISSVKADFSITETSPMELASLLMNQVVDERGKIEEGMGKEKGLSDFIVYGANLTFVDLTKASFYDLKVNGENPTSVSYIVDCVGEEGVVLVLPQPKNVEKDSNDGQVVTIILPENQVSDVKYELERDFSFD